MPVREQRDLARFQTALPGKLFVPAESSTTDCLIIDLSAGGAGVQCEDVPPLETFVVLHIDGFGRFDAVATRYVNGVLGLRFLCSENKRHRLTEKINVFVSEGEKGLTDLRRHERIAQSGSLQFTRANGQQSRCEVLDISLQGVSLKTNTRPPIGELLIIGRVRGYVVRHHEHGVGIQFESLQLPPVGLCHGD